MSQSSSTPSKADQPISGGDPSTATVQQASDQRPATRPPPIPTRNRTRRSWLADARNPSQSPSTHSLPRTFSPIKSKSVAGLSPTTAYSKSLSLPSRKDSPGPFSSLPASLERGKDRVKADEKPQVQHIGVYLPKSLNYPLDEDTVELLKDVEYQVQCILQKNEWAVRTVESEGVAATTGDAEGQKTPPRLESPDLVFDSTPEFKRTPLGSVSLTFKLHKSTSHREVPTLEDEPVEPSFEDTSDAESQPHDHRSISPDSSPTTSSTTSSRAHSCPRIRRGEDLEDFGRRICGEEDQRHDASPTNQASPDTPAHPSTDGASDCPKESFAAKMNSFSNFEAGNLNPNLARQAPQQPQAQQINGMNGVTQWPNVGAQSDMNVLWEYIVKLSDMHEQIRAQTQQVTTGMQQIDSLRSNSGGATPSSATAPHVNGAINGLPSSAENAEIARLQHELLSAHSKIEDLNTTVTTLQNLNTDYENAVSHTLDKLRPFAHSHAQALLAQKAHYLALLEQERNQNLELRLEQSQMQDKAKEVKDMLVEAMRLQSESEVGYVKKIAALKADNKSLRRICGVPLMEDSDDEEAAEAAERAQARESVRQSPEQGRVENEYAILGDERRVTIN